MEIKYSHKDFFEKDEQIRAFFNRAHQKKNFHSHSFWELVYFYEGYGLLHTSSGTKKLSSGDFILIKPDCVHSITVAEKDISKSIWMCSCIFTQKYFSEIADEYLNISELCSYTLYKQLFSNFAGIIQLSDDNAENVKHQLWAIAHEYNHYTDGSNYLIKHSLIHLLLYITRIYEYKNTSRSGVVSKNHEIDELAKYIRSHFSYNLSLEFLAQHMHLSREYLSRYFKKHMGKTISQYLLEVRMEKATHMLINSTHSINDICEYCGYSSIGNFQKAFKNAIGMSPSDYRRNFKSR